MSTWNEKKWLHLHIFQIMWLFHSSKNTMGDSNVLLYRFLAFISLYSTQEHQFLCRLKLELNASATSAKIRWWEFKEMILNLKVGIPKLPPQWARSAGQHACTTSPSHVQLVEPITVLLSITLKSASVFSFRLTVQEDRVKNLGGKF